MMALCFSSWAQDRAWFVSGAVGQAKTDFVVNGPEVKTDSTATAMAAELGYQFNRHLSLSAGYRDFGAFRIYQDTGVNQFSATVKGTAWTVGPTFHYDLTDKLQANASAGAYRWTNKIYAPQGSGSGTFSGTKAYIGAGVSYAVTPQTSVGTRWTKFKSPDSGASDVNVLDVVLKFKF